ncbi:MAG TPA: hypothetical protein PLJ25_05045 [Methanothrix sp.]|nr:hypothetical protein [Methanothrix sp.]
MVEKIFAPRRLTVPLTDDELERSLPSFANMDECIKDAIMARLDGETGPDDPEEYQDLMNRLQVCQEKLPAVYQEEVCIPFINKLKRIGQNGFNKILRKDPFKLGEASLMLDIAQAILQNGEGYNQKATDAFQEVLSDLYDGFLSEEDRIGVKKPDLSVLAPLAKWGCPDDGPYTWTAASTQYFGFGKRTAIVNMPPAHARLGLIAWAALGHETAGHDILDADTGLVPELANLLQEELEDGDVGSILPSYWSYRIDETASDVLGMLNMGPAAGIAVIGYFRALNAAAGKDPILDNIGSRDSNSVHPVDMLRGYLAAAVARRLEFSARDEWAKAIEMEVDKDLRGIKLGSARTGYIDISPDQAKRSAEIVAETLVNMKAEKLEYHSLGEIQNWRDEDDWTMMELRPLLTRTGPVPKLYAEGIYAAHAVSAAVIAALAGDGPIPLIFDRMQWMLKAMHDANPSWGPLYIAHPGDLVFVRVHSTYGP